ncbi:MAG: polysaccharide biosynthesis C-terminal domain-containing protein, partial [bacterium]|nr:polysaccharide biosynthesis C-terminal domain-containing protein [bacterium]
MHITNLFPVLLSGPIFFLSLTTLLNQSVSQGLLKFLGLVGPTMISSFGKLILGVIFVAIRFGVNGAVGAVVLGVFLAYLYSIRFVKDIKPAKPKEFEMQSFLKYSGAALIQAVAFTSIFTTDLILVKHFLSPEEAGLYAALSTLGKIVYFAS